MHIYNRSASLQNMSEAVSTVTVCIEWIYLFDRDANIKPLAGF